MRETVFIGVGSSVGNRLDFCDRAVTLLSLLPHSEVQGVSALYETEPISDHAHPGEGWFLNGVVQVQTDITPASLITVCREIDRWAATKPIAKALARWIWTSSFTDSGSFRNRTSSSPIRACINAGSYWPLWPISIHPGSIRCCTGRSRNF